MKKNRQNFSKILSQLVRSFVKEVEAFLRENNPERTVFKILEKRGTENENTSKNLTPHFGSGYGDFLQIGAYVFDKFYNYKKFVQN